MVAPIPGDLAGKPLAPAPVVALHHSALFDSNLCMFLSVSPLTPLADCMHALRRQLKVPLPIIIHHIYKPIIVNVLHSCSVPLPLPLILGLYCCPFFKVYRCIKPATIFPTTISITINIVLQSVISMLPTVRSSVAVLV